uniref:SPK domain-containing protein n=1 Tax=Caenorhabditis tropicalis TaxID=1561998 RepID=A0A1I7U471_9PELO
MVKSPGASPERKKVKISDVYPMVVKDPQARKIDESQLLIYTTALSSFETPTEEQLSVVVGDNFRHHPNEDVEKYFAASAQWGVPAIAWNIVRPAFLWKLEFCITEFMHVEKKKKDAAVPTADGIEKTVETPPKEKLSILGHKVNLIKTTPVVFNTEESIEFILEKAKSFDGFPFTWQRLCELLIEPMKHYNTIDKFLRAVDKVINVVTTINEHGGRSFGDWDLPHNQHHQQLENLFFGAVDEVEMMDLGKQKNDYQSSSEEPLDMSQKSMPAPRVSSSSPNPPSFAPPTARSPKHSSPSSPKGVSPSSPKPISPVSSPKSAAVQNQSPKKEEVKEEQEEDAKEETKEESKEEVKKEMEEENKEVEKEKTPERSIHEEEMPEESDVKTDEENKEENMEIGADAE